MTLTPSVPSAIRADKVFNMAARVFLGGALHTPEKPALIVVDDVGRAAQPAEVWTYARFEAAVRAVGEGFQQLGLERGSRVLVRLDNTSVYPIAFFGAIAAGYVPIATSSALTPREAGFLMRDSGAAAAVLAPHLPLDDAPAGAAIVTPEMLAHWIARGATTFSYAITRAGDPALMIYTSGTTAEPKGVVHAHRSILGRRPMVEGWYGLSAADRVLHAGAFNWTYTLGTGLSDPWANGATSIVYTGEKDPAFWPRIIRDTGATIFAAVPTVFRQILKYARPGRGELGHLRHGLIAGETPPPGLFDEWSEATGLELYEALGQSEISTYVSSSPSVPRRAGAVGRPQPGRRVAILPVEGGETPLAAGEEGLLAVHRSDPGLMLGYWNRPAEDAAVTRGEWFVGGDLAMMDADGYVFHRGRADDVVKALGYRISPQEIEAVIAGHPGVAEVACTAVEARPGVSILSAFVVAKDGAPHDGDAILAFAAERLADYKRPRQIAFVDALPRTANGKIKRSSLAGR